MYDTLTFPTVASDVFQCDSLRVSVDATFACVVVEHSAGRDVFRFDEPTRSFVFVCASIADDALQDDWPAMCDVSGVLCDLAPWLIDEIAAVKKAWTEFFDGGRELPVLTRSERQSLRRGRLRLVAGIDPLIGMSGFPVVQERPIRSELQAI
ncbi:hypothetical protein [Thauera sp. AutoDN2]|uniref:hypothetical protein n=1 Tax=Thauera sp. AutoDN2 TaxID=3416051 RepID=UPI003F4B1276